MRVCPHRQLWPAGGLLLAVCLVGCEKPTVLAPQTTPPEPPLIANTETSRPVPRRTQPLVITNVVPQEEPVAAVTNSAPSITCGGAQNFPCTSPDGMQVTLSAQVEDVDGNALSVVWNIDGKDRYTQQVAAGGPPTVAELTYAYTLTPGEHAVKVTVLDGALSASCTTTVTMQEDAQEPVVACPQDIVVPVDPGQCSAVVTFTARASDNCSEVVVTCDPPSGSAFPIGTTPVTCTATDAAGNVAACAFNVVVQFSNRCPRTDAYWRQSPGAWPVTSVRLGGQIYSKTQIGPLIRATVSADASMVLARQLIAATLNTAAGSDPRPICADLAQAHGLLEGFPGKLPYRVNVSSEAGRSMIELSTRLLGYNNGLLTPNCVP